MSKANKKELNRKDIAFWSEFNLAKHSLFLFPPSKSSVLTVPRRHEVKSSTPGDEPETITIFPNAAHPAPDQFCYDVLLSILFLKEEKEITGNTIKTTFQEIRKYMGMRSGGTKNITKIKNAILSLNYTMIHFNNSWTKPDGTIEIKETNFSFISVMENSYIKDKTKAELIFKQDHLKLSLPDQIINSIAGTKRCCVSLSERRSIKNTISRMFYSHADRIIARTGKWTKNGDDIIEMMIEHRPWLSKKARQIDLIDKLVLDVTGTKTSWGETISVRAVKSRTSVHPKLEFSAIPPKIKSTAKFVKLKANSSQVKEEIKFMMNERLRIDFKIIESNKGLQKVVDYGDIETVRIAISTVREDKQDFNDIKDIKAYFVSKFKTLTNERKTQNPFLSG